jgi:superfamily I DNA/RNA helicase
MVNLHTLNPQQRLAAETIRGPVLILAGAGTGKTRVITFRIAHMVQSGIAPGNILGVTFTNKAAREMRERVNKLLPNSKLKIKNSKTDERPTICTFHSLCVRILRQHIEKLGYKRNFVIYDESEQLSAVKKILANISAKGEKTDPGAVLAMLSKFKNLVGQASSLSSSSEKTKLTGKMPVPLFGDENIRALAEHIAKRYESALHACNAVDFDDLILLTLRLFNEHPDALAACRAKYRYVMVDEYQDTNAAQFQLVHALTLEHRNLCVVGDDDQSIYGWRGAEVANLLNMEKHFPEIKVIKLEQNYRSTTTILNAANAIIKNNVRRRVKQLWSQRGTGAKIQLQTYDNDETEAREVVAQIEFKRLAHRVRWEECAILFRTNQQSRPIETELRKANVRYHLIGGQSFFDRREIKDFIAFLKTFLNPHDDISLLRIANVPARGLSDVTMERLLGASHERKCSVFTAMKNPLVTTAFQKNTRECIEALVTFIEKTQAQLQSAGGLTLPAWAENFLNETGYFAELHRAEKNPEVSEARVRNLRELVATMNGSAPTLAEQLDDFLENITLDSDREEEKENTADAVTLITMHSCKGLEFPHVFIVGLEDGLLPHSRSKIEGTLDEERRLFYVAVTRAMLTLTISHCAGRKKYGQLLPCQPSPFLKELPEELVETSDSKSKTPVALESGKNLFAAMRSVVNH